MLERLTHRLQVLVNGPADSPPRQRTLRNALTWSHELLSPAEQVLFRRLAVFDSGWTLEAAETVCTRDTLNTADILDLIGSLGDKSLLVRSSSDTGDRALECSSRSVNMPLSY